MSTMNRSKVIDDQNFYDVIAPTLENGPKPVLETSFSKMIFSVIPVCVGQCRFTPKTSLKSLEKPEIFVEISRQCNSFIQTWEKFVCYLLFVTLLQTAARQRARSYISKPLNSKSSLCGDVVFNLWLTDYLSRFFDCVIFLVYGEESIYIYV